MKDYRIRVSGLSSRMEEETLQKTFGKAGQVTEVSLKGSKAYIKFKTAEDAYEAVQTWDGEKLEGRKIKIRIKGWRDGRSESEERDKSKDRDPDSDRDRDRDRHRDRDRQGYRDRDRDRDADRDRDRPRDSYRRRDFDRRRDDDDFKYSRRDRDTGGQDIMCFVCHEKGHKQFQCSKRDEKSEPPKVCYKCNMSGHIARFCPTSMDNGRHPPRDYRRRERDSDRSPDRPRFRKGEESDRDKDSRNGSPASPPRRRHRDDRSPSDRSKDNDKTRDKRIH